MKVYLCGPINGCTDEVAKDWRSMVKAVLPILALDPMDRDYRGRELERVAKEIVENDKADIDQCGGLLVGYVKPSVGTSMEFYTPGERKEDDRSALRVGREPVALARLSRFTLLSTHTLKDAVGLLAEENGGVVGR